MNYQEQPQVKLAQAVRILHNTGLLEVWGHISARADERSCHVLGHLHIDGRILSGTTPDDIVTVGFDGKLLEGVGKPPGEIYIHTEIYKRRPDVNAVVHHHGQACITLSIVDQEVMPVWTQATPFVEGTPIFDRPEQIDNPEVGAKVAEVLADKRGAFLKGHGAIVVGQSIEEACVLSVVMERTARMQLDAAAVGQPKPIPREALAGGMTRGLTMSELIESYWEFFVAKYPLY